MNGITSVAKVKRKTKEGNRIESLMPEQWLLASEKLLELLREYYVYMGLEGKPSYEINSILEARNVDTADDKYLDEIQKQIAIIVPRLLTTTRQTLYKGITDFYKIRGSVESINVFFKVFLLDDVQIRYPYDQVLIPSSGNWDPTVEKPVFDENGVQTGTTFGVYLDNKGFLSDNIFIQDSFFYQKFSYVIQTATNQDRWGLPYSKLVHPAGFIFFSEIVLLLFAVGDEATVQSIMPKIQPGFIGLEDLPVIIELFASIAVNNHHAATEFVKRLLAMAGVSDNKYFERKWIDLLKFYDTTPIEYYKDITIEQVNNYDINRKYNVGTIIDITTV